MAKKIIKAQMKQRLDTKANWAAKNPVLLAGELGIVSDYPNLYKVGNGTAAWNDLPFRGFDGTLVHTTGDSETAAMSQKGVTAELAKLSVEIGNVYNGQDWDNPYLLRSNYIPCENGDTLFGHIYTVAKYDSNLNYIGDMAGSSDALTSSTLTISDSLCKFVRVVLFKDAPSHDITINNENPNFKIEKNLVLQSEKSKKDIQNLKDSLGQYETNPEYIIAYTDKEGRFLWGIKADGRVEFGKGVPTPIKEYIKENVNFEMIDMLSTTYQYISNEEWLCAIIDNNEHILWGIKADGTIINNGDVSFNKKIKLSEDAMSEFKRDLVASGFNVTSPIDWSNEKSISLPIPRSCAKVNIISESGLGTTKTDDKKCRLEYWDKDGNFFAKYIILNAQGSSSMLYLEKNQGIDVFNDEACEESCDITFGNWVAQDSFHLKCYYIDVFRGIANIGYNLCEEAIKLLCTRNNRIVLDDSSISAENSTGNFNIDFGDGALCHPDGFPFELYVNGEYYGLFAWNLKKHRKNYSMNKNDYSAILLDGEIGANELFGGNIDWTAFELRNPKDLVTMDGGKYDGENPSELIDSTSSAYNASNSAHTKTAQTKAQLIRQSKAIGRLAAESNTASARAIYEQYYDVRAMACYFIMSNLLYHYDGFWKNWIWTIYGNTAAPSFYDLDSIFGRSFDGLYVVNNSTSTIIGADLTLPTGQLVRLYKAELDEMYSSLRKEVISVSNIMSIVNSWMKRVGLGSYKRNIDKWTSIPSYRAEKNMDDGTQEGGFFDSAKRIELWLKDRINTLDEYFNY